MTLLLIYCRYLKGHPHGSDCRRTELKGKFRYERQHGPV